jgi:immediate early response 3-interacting protein 1
MLGLGTILYVSVLFINAIAILNEERFLARSPLSSRRVLGHISHDYLTVGWTSSPQAQQANAYQGYDQTGYGQPEPTIKARLITLIGAVRTLLRSA